MPVKVFALFPLIVIVAVLGAIVLAGLVTAFSRRTHPAVRVILAIPLTIVALAVGLLVLYRYFGVVEHATVTKQRATPRPPVRQAAPVDWDDSDTIDVRSVEETAIVPANGNKKNSNMAELLGDALRNAVGFGNRRQAELERQMQAQRDVFQEQMGALKSAQSQGMAKVQSELRRVQAEVMRVATGATPAPMVGKAKAPPPSTPAAKTAEETLVANAAVAKATPSKPAPAAPTPAATAAAAPTAAALAPKDLVPTDQRPEWADQPARLENGRILVTTSPYPTGAECDAALVDLLDRNVKKYVAHRLGPEAAEEVRLPLDHLRTRVVKSYWLQPVTLSMGKMVQLHALMQFDHDANLLIDQQWRQVQATRRNSYAERRIWIAAGGLAALLYLLAIAYGYLRVDLSTKGAYRWRLRLAATTLIAVPTLALLLTLP
jgi:hypothetical protein